MLLSLFQLPKITTLLCKGYLNDHLVFVGIPETRDDFVVLYDYNTKNKVLKGMQREDVQLTGRDRIGFLKVGDLDESFYHLQEQGK